MSDNSTAIRLQDIHQHFKVVHERPDTVRETFANLFRKGRSFEDFHALKGISFRVQRGETVGVIGRNGSGKSTILKIIAGVYVPTSGRVEVQGKVAALIELGAGFHPELTGRENIALNGLLLGFTKRQMKEREAQIIEFAELGEFIDAPVKQYSSGMYGRLAFAVATEVDPEILLLDEILSVGDAGFQQKCMERMKRFHDSDKSILFVSHDLSAVASFCDRVVLIHRGELVADGRPDEVIAHYEGMFSQPTAAVRT